MVRLRLERRPPETGAVDACSALMLHRRSREVSPRASNSENRKNGRHGDAFTGPIHTNRHLTEEIVRPLSLLDVRWHGFAPFTEPRVVASLRAADRHVDIWARVDRWKEGTKVIFDIAEGTK